MCLFQTCRWGTNWKACALLCSEKRWSGRGNGEQAMQRDPRASPCWWKGELNGEPAQTRGCTVGFTGRKASFPLTTSEVSPVWLGVCMHVARPVYSVGLIVFPGVFPKALTQASPWKGVASISHEAAQATYWINTHNSVCSSLQPSSGAASVGPLEQQRGDQPWAHLRGQWGLSLFQVPFQHPFSSKGYIHPHKPETDSLAFAFPTNWRVSFDLDFIVTSTYNYKIPFYFVREKDDLPIPSVLPEQVTATNKSTAFKIHAWPHLRWWR